MVPGLANRNGHKNVAEGRNTSGWGDVRANNILVAEIGRWLHPDVVSVKLSRTTLVLTQLAVSDDD